MGQTRPKKVLIAEDEALIRLDLVELLTDEGFEVVGQAINGEEAVKLARELEPDLIIMDVKMPGMDGITAAEIIGEERIAPILMLTAFSERELVERARDAGVMGYLVKPFGAKELANLEDRFESRKIIDQAKGMQQEGLGLTEPEAFRWIQKTAMDLRKSMREVAEGVISHKRKK